MNTVAVRLDHVVVRSAAAFHPLSLSRTGVPDVALAVRLAVAGGAHAATASSRVAGLVAVPGRSPLDREVSVPFYGAAGLFSCRKA